MTDDDTHVAAIVDGLRVVMGQRDRLMDLAGAMYQVAGAADLEPRVLDVLSAAASGRPFDPQSILPYPATDGKGVE